VTPTFDGTVVRKLFAQGSKSEHDAVVLTTAQGDFLLRREGGNPFADPVLDALVGKVVRCDGVLLGTTLLVKDWTETGPAEAGNASADSTGDEAEAAGPEPEPEQPTAAAPPDGPAAQEEGAAASEG
jgi:hypothetical protein